jgi:NAD+ kinase
MKIVLSPNPYRDKGLKAAQAAAKILDRANVESVMCLPFDLDPRSKIDLPKHLDFRDMKTELEDAEMLICFGGDGTILHAAKDANPQNVPVLGVNMGSVGFMAELEHGELSKLAKVAAGDYTIENRMMLNITVTRDGKQIFQDVALNDAVVIKGAVGRVVELEVHADHMPMSSFSGDGVIISTPTGSTAYSMSAGGPIVEPTAENLIVTPICPHALYAKSFILGPDRLVSVYLDRRSHKTAYLSIDGGRAFKLLTGDAVEMKKSSRQTRLVKLTGKSFYELINQKLGEK